VSSPVLHEREDYTGLATTLNAYGHIATATTQFPWCYNPHTVIIATWRQIVVKETTALSYFHIMQEQDLECNIQT